MGLLDRLIVHDQLHSRETRDEIPVVSEKTRNTFSPDRDDRRSAARGIVIGTALGMVVWAVILWGLKWQISDLSFLRQ